MNIMKKRWGYLALAVIILLFMGIGYAFSLFVAPIEEDLGLTRSDTSSVFTLCFLCFALGSLITGFMLRKLSPKLLLRVGAVMLLAGFMLSTRASKVWHLYLSYGVLCGYAIGIAYNTMISLLPLYFHDQIGVATGILLMGYAMSTTVLGPVCQWGIAACGWKTVFLVLGICCFLILVLGSLVIHMPDEKEKALLPKAAVSTGGGRELPPSGILRTGSYYVFLMVYITIGGVGMSVINHGAMALREDLQVASGLSALLVGFICLFNGVGRVLWGMIYDRIGGARCLRYLGVLLVLGMSMAWGSLLLWNIPMAVLGMSLAMFCYGGSSSLAPILVRDLFGDTYFSMNFAVTNIGTMILSSVPAFIGAIQTRTHSYVVPFMVLMGFAVTALIMSCLYQPAVKREYRLCHLNGSGPC